MLIEQLMFGLKVALIGMVVTFIGLIILIGLVQLNRVLAESINKTKHSDQPKAEPSEGLKKNLIPENNTPKSTDKDGNVIAAITAAVSVMMEGKAFKVKSVKQATAPAQRVSAWDIVAIQEQNNNL